jgi:hypothetical protein
VETAEVAWPKSLEDLAQDLLQAALQGNTALMVARRPRSVNKIAMEVTYNKHRKNLRIKSD